MLGGHIYSRGNSVHSGASFHVGLSSPSGEPDNWSRSNIRSVWSKDNSAEPCSQLNLKF
jgi:hypothetical protein